MNALRIAAGGGLGTGSGNPIWMMGNYFIDCNLNLKFRNKYQLGKVNLYYSRDNLFNISICKFYFVRLG